MKIILYLLLFAFHNYHFFDSQPKRELPFVPVEMLLFEDVFFIWGGGSCLAFT